MTMRFSQFLAEASTEKLTHLQHVEEFVFEGVDGIRKSINSLLSLWSTFKGNNKDSLHINRKLDGAPSLVFGTNPENGKFFVATKSAFAKDPKLCYSSQDVDKYYPNPGLSEKMKVALVELPKLKFSGVLQGDFMYIKSELKIGNLGGEKCVYFRPNTIVYAIPVDSDLGKQVLASKMGMGFHTKYSGNTMASLKSGFGVIGVQSTRDVWIPPQTVEDVAGTATLTQTETEAISAYLAEIERMFKKLKAPVIDGLFLGNSEINKYISQYINQTVKLGDQINSPETYVTGLVGFINQKFKVQIDALKTDKGKERQKEQLETLVGKIESNKAQMVTLFALYNLMTKTKLVFIKKLNSLKSMGTFLPTGSGDYKVTAPEGFVVSDHAGNVYKLIDRLEFSKANFTIAKEW